MNIQTERLELHPPCESDAAEIFARYAADSRVTKYLSWPPHQSIEDTLAYLRTTAQAMADRKLETWLIRLRSSGQLLGSIGYGRNGHRSDLGYCLARDAWGQGYATEATCAVSATCLAEPAIWRLQAICELQNIASARVLEKNGFALEGTLRRCVIFPNLGSEPRDVLCFSKVRSGAAGVS
jgi:[ribosomal protein S5]-alanine N-acetyltransferase